MRSKARSSAGCAITRRVGEGIADFGALVEARAADHPIGQAELNEAIFEFAHLERGAHQDGDFIKRVILAALARLALELLDLLADRACFFLGVPGAGDLHLLAQLVLGAQRLAKAAFVMGDQLARRRQDVAGAAVVSLEADDFGAGKVVFVAQNVIDLGPAPAIDRLVVIAHAADVFRGTRNGNTYSTRHARLYAGHPRLPADQQDVDHRDSRFQRGPVMTGRAATGRTRRLRQQLEP